MFFSLFNIHRSMACDRTIATVVSIDLMRRRLPLFLFGITWLTVVQFDTHSASGIETLPDSISVSSTASLDAASESSTSSTVASSRSNSSLRSVTLKDFSRLMDMLSSGVSLSSAPKNGSCENVIRYNGFEYVCYEKVNFIFVMALILFVLFIVFTVFGNSLVILAILRDRRLRTPSTYLILSLAVTDLIVGLVTVPIRAFSELKDYGTWPYGAIWCDLRVVVDKMCVYASLLHLVAIALDRYLTVSSLSYSLTRSGKQILYMISVAWGVSFGLAAAPMFGWRDDQFGKRIRAGSCFVNTLFSLNLTVWLVIFVIPVLSILVLYYKVYQVVKNRMKTNDKVARPVESVSGQMSTQVTNTSSIGNSIKMNAKPETAVQSKRKSSISSIGNDAKHLESSAAGQGRSANEGATGDEPHNERQQKLQEQKSRRESKAANTLVLITICVIVCWLPFYSMYTISSIFKLKFGSTSNFWFKMTIWLGYFNSLLNPLIYAITNPYYRDAFRRILF